MQTSMKSHIWPLTYESGPKGDRTPDLMAASHNALNGVLCSVSAGRR
jgi:hypothetical protein